MRSIGGHAVLYAIGQVLSRAVAFLMLPIYTRFLSPADYGVMALIDLTLDVIAIIAGAQVAQGVFRFYHKADTEAERRAVVATTLTALVVSYGLFGGIVMLAARPLSQLIFGSEVYTPLIRISAISFALQSFILVATVFGRVQERSALVVGSSLLKLGVAVTLNLVFLVGMGLGVRGVFYSTLISNLVLATWLGTWTIRRVGLGVHRDTLRSLIRYGGPLVGVQAATFIMTFSDRYFLKSAGNEAMVGLYNLAYQFGFLMLMLGFVPIEMIWGPRRFQVARSPEPSRVLSSAFRLINVSVLTIGVGIALFVGDLLRIMSTPPFHPAANVVPIILVAYVFHGWAMLHDIGVLVKERTGFLTVANWVAAVVALAAFALLVPRYYASGAAIAAVIAFGVRWGLTYVFSQRLWKVEYDWPPILWLAGLGVAVVLGSVMLPRADVLPSFAIHLGLLTLYCGLVWFAPILTASEKETALRTVQRLARSVISRAARRSGSRHHAS